MRTRIYVVIIVLISIASGMFLVNSLKESNLVFQLPNKNSCTSDADCDWAITNCCPETAGAKWNCVNVKNKESPIACPKSVICPQVISPKPDQTCGCAGGVCGNR